MTIITVPSFVVLTNGVLPPTSAFPQAVPHAWHTPLYSPLLHLVDTRLCFRSPPRRPRLGERSLNPWVRPSLSDVPRAPALPLFFRACTRHCHFTLTGTTVCDPLPTLGLSRGTASPLRVPFHLGPSQMRPSLSRGADGEGVLREDRAPEPAG